MMSKFVAFVAKHDKAILNAISVVFLVPMIALALIDMDNMLAVIGLLVGYVVVAGVFLLIASADVRRSQRNRKRA